MVDFLVPLWATTELGASPAQVGAVVAVEAAASLLYRDVSQAGNVAPALKPTATDCKALGIADEVVREPSAGSACGRSKNSA